MTDVRTRFAPSPTGYLHIGGARTAIFNWLFARHHGGTFVLRIEDTDRERSTDESIQQILDAMAWLGLDHDEGPFRQTDRFGRYAEVLGQLLSTGHAYRCTCSKEELDARREAMMAAGQKPMYDGACRDKNIPADCGEPFVVRVRTPREGTTVVHDLLRGDVVFENRELDDMIVARTDGTPTYNFCVVVDDADMRISHVIRGDDHLANTPRQIVIYEALGLTVPAFAHVSMILGDDGKRLSKRHGALSVLEYRDQGILPEAFVNYLARLGWSHGDQERFTIDEMITHFGLDGVSKSAARLDTEKLSWLNAEWVRAMDDAKLAPMVVEGLAAEGIGAVDADILPLLGMLKPRARLVADLVRGARYFLADQIEYDEQAAAKFLTAESAALLTELSGRLAAIDVGDAAAVEATVMGLLDDKGLKLKEIAQPARVALTGNTVSPGLWEMMAAMGKQKVLARLAEGIRRGQGAA